MFEITEIMCRVCLGEKDPMISIYDELTDLQTNLCNLLETCADLQINENDVFPKYLCMDCTRELLITSAFLEKCCKSKGIFNEILENAKPIESEDYNNANDLIEYCEEEENDVDIIDFIIQDDVIEKDEYSVICNDTKPREQGIESSVLEKCITDQLKDSKLHNGTKYEYETEETASLHTNEETHADSDALSDNIHNTNSSGMDDLLTTTLEMTSKAKHVFKCDLCGALFKQAINLQKHIQKSHNPLHCFSCNKCSHCFSLEVEYYKHIEKCGYTSQMEVEKVNSKSENTFTAIEQTHAGRKCIYCERNFSTPFALRMHLRTHTGERPFPCTYCTKSFKTQSQLNVHHKRHTGQADFRCTFCNKLFYEQSNLSVHLRSHTGERPHTCTICNKTFARVFLLQIHMRTHTGEKPFKCNNCDKSFRQHADLRSHMIIHFGHRQHTCKLCAKTYIKHSHLVQHMRKHQIYTVNAEGAEVEVGTSEQNFFAFTAASDVINVDDIHSFNEIINSENNLP